MEPLFLPAVTVDPLPKIRELASTLEKLNDTELVDQATELRIVRSRSDETSISMAFVLEATRRVLGIELYDVQLMAGLALLRGSIVEMQTGEGKTLAAMSAAICQALSGRHVHLMTVNSYLARRDFQQLQPVYNLLGLKVGLTDSGMCLDDKQLAYRSNVVYGPGYEFGFDFLRDQLQILSNRPRELGHQVRQRWRSIESPRTATLQSQLDVVMVDEADSVMLDEATTPLLLSENARTPSNNANVYIAANGMAEQFILNQHYQVDSQNEALRWTSDGVALMENCAPLITDGLERNWPQYVHQAIVAQRSLHRNVHYVVHDGQIGIIDQQTGRIFQDRSWGEGLQQAVEAKEGLTISSESQATARITRQRFLRCYKSLSGLTGTTVGSEREFKANYDLDVTVIPTHRPNQLIMLEAHWSIDCESQEKEIAFAIIARQRTGQPVLVGTTSIRSSKRISEQLTRLGIVHQCLNGLQDCEESKVIARAGNAGTVTVATSMAGRGTDIPLTSASRTAGGLHLIVTELYSSVRVERQMIGRAARQGDPGSCQMILSADDPLLVRHTPSLCIEIRKALESRSAKAIDFMPAIRELQSQIERLRAAERRQLFLHDDWLENLTREWH